jgi:hypothetical protein
VLSVQIDMASYLLGPLKRYLSDALTARLAEYVEGIELGGALTCNNSTQYCLFCVAACS